METKGCQYEYGSFCHYWPEVNTLHGRQDVENLKITKIGWSRWGSSDNDLSGFRLYPVQGGESPIIG